jgi:hypothetical protein
VIGNGGLVPSGNGVSGARLSCSNVVCTGITQADHVPNPGTLDLQLVFTKPGQYSLCITAELAPLIFNQACSAEKFNIRPWPGVSGRRAAPRRSGRRCPRSPTGAR